ncbi:MAG: hypothetical protein J6S85_12675 [Methanobrevibacter sp.]|nr:hypothetical protein [Methanobrevibacter sp.]
MFEKEAEEYAKGIERKASKEIVWLAFKDGAEFGYNKANEYHKVADGDLPKVDNKIVLCVCANGYIDGKRNYSLRLLTRKEFPLHLVYYWKEIVLPELKESE